MQKTASQIADEVLEKVGGKTGPFSDMLELVARQRKQFPGLRRLYPSLVHPSNLRKGIMRDHQPFGPGSNPTLKEMLVGEGPGYSEFIQSLGK